MCRITAITAGKGGTGKTMFAVNLASCLAMRGSKVLLIDMNSGFRNLDICLGLENQIVYDISDVVNGICTIKKALIRDRRFRALYLLSASQMPEKAQIKPAHMQKLCEKLSEKFDHIIIDAPQGIGEDWQTAISPADRAVIVTTQEYVSLRDADSVGRKLLSCGIREISAVVNRIRPAHGSNAIFPSISDIAESLRFPVCGMIQEDENIYISMNSGIPVVCKKDSYITKNFVNMIERIFEVS